MNAIQQIIGWMPALLQATGVTLALSVTSVLTALVLAVFLALGKISKNTVLRSVCGAYIFFFRGTPLLMQLFFLYYTLPQLVPAFNIQSRFLAAWIAFSLNVAAYLAEIIRAGILAVDGGQNEAARSLGLSSWQSMKLVVLPQAIKNILPALANELVTMVKESSICSVLGMTELIWGAKTVATTTYKTLSPYVLAALVYFVINYPAGKAIEAIERRMRRGDRI